MIMTQNPLLLKDYLELDGDSSGSGFQCAPRCAEAGATTLRSLLQAELPLGSGMDVNHVRQRQLKNTLAKFSALINAVKLLQFSLSSSSGHGDRRVNSSPSRISKAGIWIKKWPQRRWDGEEKSEKKLVPTDIVRQLAFPALDSFGEIRSFAFPSPAVSDRRTWSETSSSRFGNLPSTDASYEDLDGIAAAITTPLSYAGDVKPDLMPLPPAGVAVDESDKTGAGARAGKAMDGGKEMEALSSSYEAEKGELSPISVMVFPCEEDDEEEDADGDNTRSSISFYENHVAERGKVGLQRWQNVAKLDPTAASFAHVEPSKEDELDVMGMARGLLEQLHVEAGPLGDVEELLLLDFFVRSLSCSHEINRRNRIRRDMERVPQELLTVASDWMGGAGNVEDCLTGTMAIREMEKDGRWGCIEEEEIEIGVRDLEGTLLEFLLEELVVDIRSLF